eukprot:6479281-Amphidinium_carterae.2
MSFGSPVGDQEHERNWRSSNCFGQLPSSSRSVQSVGHPDSSSVGSANTLASTCGFSQGLGHAS